jgi:hypothetical protein
MTRIGFKREVLELFASQTEDPIAQENFDRIRQFLERAMFLRFEGDKFEIEFSGAVTNFRYTHNLGFVPKDVWLTSDIGAGSATFNYELFSDTELDITTSGAVTIRFFAGSFIDG